MTETPVTTVPSLLRQSSIAVGVLVMTQALLGLVLLVFSDSLKDVHKYIGMATMLAAIVAAVAAIMWKRNGGPTGLMAHAISTAVLAIAQFGLGEMGDDMRGLHLFVGFLVLGAGLGLTAMATRKR
ncbi:MAG TPA: hypothetical protein PKK40_00800 [Marmoricola sp.]|nr:hypothetical protein [Marmoricola sp.]